MAIRDTVIVLEAFEVLTKSAHENSKSKGFWDEGIQNTITDGCMGEQPTQHKLRPTNVGEKLMLMVSELAELFEAYRKGKQDDPCDKDCEMIDPKHRTEEDPIGHRRLTNTEEELADVVIRVLDFCGWKGIDLGRVVLAKMQYNSTRPHMHGRTC